MEAMKKAVPVVASRQHTAAGERGATVPAPAAPMFRVPFGMAEVLRLTGLSHSTLRFWIRRGWVQPISRFPHGGSGNETQFSAWQTIALCVIADAHRTVRSKSRSYIGRSSVIKAMESLAGLSDEMLLPEHLQDPHLAEAVSAIAQDSFTSHEDALTPETYDRIARVLEAIDRKVGAIRARERNRVVK